MMINGGAINSTAINGSGSAPEIYAIELTIEQHIVEVYPVELTIEQHIVEVYPIELTIDQQIYDPAIIAVCSRWDARVWLAGVEVSDRLTGQLEVDAEAGAARLAEFTLLADPGPLNLQAYVNAPISIDFVGMDESGAELATLTLYNGVVDVPEYNLMERTINYTCTDTLQRAFEGLPRTVIDGAVAGDWSPFIFDENADPWAYVQDRMSTQPADLDMDVNRALVKTPWLAKTTPDFTYTDNELLQDRPTVSSASARNLVNRVSITMEYRFERLLQRQVSYSYAPPIVRYIDGMPAPAPAQIGQAIRASGWALEGAPVFGGLPDPGYYFQSSGTEIFYDSDCPRYSYAGSASFVLAKRWAQTVTETHSITVGAPVSIAAVGPLAGFEHVSLRAGEDDARPADWDKPQEATIAVALFSGSPLMGSCDSFVNWHELGVVRYAQPVPADMATFAETGDKYLDLDDRARDGRAAFDQAFRTAVAKASVEIQQSHRSGRVKDTVALNPLLDRTHTVRIEADGQTVQGRLARVRHVLDIDSGSALTEFEIAVSSPLGVGLIDPPPVTDPDKPVTTQAAEAFNPATAGSLPSYYLAAGDSEMSDTQQGWSPQLDEFRVLTPAIDAANINHSTVTASHAFEVAIPVDEFSLEA